MIEKLFFLALDKLGGIIRINSINDISLILIILITIWGINSIVELFKYSKIHH